MIPRNFESMVKLAELDVIELERNSESAQPLQGLRLALTISEHSPIQPTMSTTPAQHMDLTNDESSPMETVLCIPANIRNIILPSKLHSVTSLLQSSIIPGPCGLLEPGLHSMEAWISAEPPCAAFKPQHLLQIVLPPLNIAKQLLELLSNGDFSTTKAIRAAHVKDEPKSDIPTLLPLWAAAYWTEAHRARAARQAWRVGLEWAQHSTAGSVEGRKELELLKKNLAHFAWDDTLKGDVKIPTALTGASYYMPTYLSHARLAGSHIDQLLACLQRRLEESPRYSWASPHTIVGPDVAQSIVSASQDTPENIAKLSVYSSLRMLECDLVLGCCISVGGVAWINKNHYTFFVLHPEEQLLGYGDSMGGEMPQSLRSGLLWWIRRLIEKGMKHKNGIPAEQWLRPLPVTAQAKGDGFSCGMLAVNGLEHHYLPDRPLLDPARCSLAAARISAFNDICKIHFEAVSHLLVDVLVLEPNKCHCRRQLLICQVLRSSRWVLPLTSVTRLSRSRVQLPAALLALQPLPLCHLHLRLQSSSPILL